VYYRGKAVIRIARRSVINVFGNRTNRTFVKFEGAEGKKDIGTKGWLMTESDPPGSWFYHNNKYEIEPLDTPVEEEE